MLTLSGLETIVKQSAPKKPEKVNTIVYADDFIVTADSRDILENKVKPAIKAFLAVRGLALSETKTEISPIKECTKV